MHASTESTGPADTRREFLANVGGLTAGAILASKIGQPVLAALPRPQTSASAPRLSAPTSAAGLPRSRLVEARSDRVIIDRAIQKRLLGELLEDALMALTEQKTPPDAWRHLLGDPPMLGLKFNRSGATAIATTEPLALALVESLAKAGLDPARIVLIEAPAGLLRRTNTQPAVFGWTTRTVNFGSGKDQLAAVLDQVTDLINIPFLKTHNIAGMTGCLKNLSHALIKHPARYHANGCSPFVGDIVALPDIRDKLRLHLVDALRIVFEGGPAARHDCIATKGTLLLSTDGVAADVVGLQLIDQERASRKLAVIGDTNGAVPHLQAAADRHLGTLAPDRIERHRVTL